MSYQVELVNKHTLSHIKLVEVVNEPSIKEEINGEYSLNFEAHYEAKSNLNANVFVKVNGQHYQIKKLTKSRSDSITLSVQCEHVSYELIIDGDYEEDWEIESTAQGMINSILSGTRFTLGSCISTNFAYYRTKRRDKRQQLSDIANLFGGELHFDNFTVNFVLQRGSDKGLDIELGVNLLGVTEEIDFVEGTNAYELDLVDLSRVSGYELDFSSAEIGDTIGISDNVLGINTNERIIAIEYNPFKRQLPTVTVGQYMRDFTEYLKDEEEATLKTNESWLEVFSIGETNVLYLDDLDTGGGAVVELDVKSPVVTMQVKREHIGDAITVNLFDSYGSQYANYNEHAFDSNGRLLIEGDFPRGTTGSIEIIITEKGTGERREYFVSVEDISADSFEDYWLETLLVGTEETIHLDGLNISNGGEGADHFIDDKVDTITIKVKDAYKDYVKAVSIYNDSNVIVYTRGSSHFVNGQVVIKREFPMTNRGSIKIAVMHPETKVKQTFLVAVSTNEENPIEPESMLSEFRMGDVDCLSLEGVQIESASVSEIIAEIEYTKPNEFIGLILSLKEEHKSATITAKNQNGTSINYNNSTVLPNGNTALIVTVTKGQEKQYYGVKFTQIAFEGLITIKSKLENGTVIGTREMDISEEDTYEINADEFEGYELVSEPIKTVTITRSKQFATVEFIYRSTDDDSTSGSKRLTLETASGAYFQNMIFEFTKPYTEVVSVVVTATNGQVKYALQTNFDGKYTGVLIQSSTNSTSTVHLQAVVK